MAGGAWWAGAIICALGIYDVVNHRFPTVFPRPVSLGVNYLIALGVGVLLAEHWAPLGPEKGIRNGIFVAVLLGGVLLLFALFGRVYERILRWCLNHKLLFLSIPGAIVLWGAVIWLGVDRARISP